VTSAVTSNKHTEESFHTFGIGMVGFHKVEEQKNCA